MLLSEWHFGEAVHKKDQADAPSEEKGRCPVTTEKYVVSFFKNCTVKYLRTFTDSDGLDLTYRLDAAKQFSTRLHAQQVANFFGGLISRVLVNGQEIRLAFLPKTEPTITHYRHERPLESEIERSL